MFSQLPSELRLLFWKTASFITRNVGITTERRGSIRRRLATGYQKLRAYKYLSRCLPPAILHTNKQSQAEDLKWYHLDFGYIIDGAGDFGYSAPPEIYVNWHADRICFMGPAGRGSPGSIHISKFAPALQDFQRHCTENRVPQMACNFFPITHQNLLSLLPPGLLLEDLVLFGCQTNPFSALHYGGAEFEESLEVPYYLEHERRGLLTEWNKRRESAVDSSGVEEMI